MRGIQTGRMVMSMVQSWWHFCLGLCHIMQQQLASTGKFYSKKMKPLQHERLPKTDWLYHTNSGFLPSQSKQKLRGSWKNPLKTGCNWPRHVPKVWLELIDLIEASKMTSPCSFIPHVLDVNITVPAQGHELAWSARQG